MQYVVEKKVLLGYTGVNGDVSALFFDKLIFSMSVKIHYLYTVSSVKYFSILFIGFRGSLGDLKL